MNTPINDRVYQADPQMLYTIIRVVQKLKRDCYICDIFLLIYTACMYNKYADDMEIFIYLEVGIVLFLGFAQYLLIVAKGKFINKAIIDISIVGDEILIKTAAFSGPFWYKKGSVDLKFSKAQTTVSPMVNPYPSIFRDDKQITKLKYKDKEAYIVDGYFNWRLEEDLYGKTE
ncbi:MAG: hypothetical protein V4592_04965 [Bacteroidota bacterium]